MALPWSAQVSALLAPFTEATSRTWWPSLIGGLLVAGVWHLARGGRISAVGSVLGPPGWWKEGSVRVDVLHLLARRLLALTGFGAAVTGGTWLAVRVALALDHTIGRPTLPALPAAAVLGVCSLLAFVVSDASRFGVHVLLHRVPALWAFHQVHHSATVLTPLTFHRIHPVEGVLYGVRGAVVIAGVGGLSWWLFREQAEVATIVGVSAFGLVLNTLFGNLRHSHVWMGFGALERWLMSPAQHQLHHSADPADHGLNYGTWLAVWDRMLGSWRASGPTAPAAFGLAPEERNHEPDDLFGLWVGPFVSLAQGAWRGRTVALLAVASASARAEEPEEPVPDDEDVGVVIVESEGGVPSVAGSATVIDEAELDRYAYDDIHRVLARAPGVYVRGEDGYGLRPNIGIRGANSDRSAKVVLMEDGVLMGPAPYGAPAAYYFPLPLRLTGVEVFKGPASVRYGPNTIGGAINFRTRAVPEEGGAGALDLAVGLRDTVRAHAWGGYGTASGGIVGEVAHLGTAGFKELDGGGPTGFERTDALLKTRVAWGGSTRHALELKGGYGREISDETYLGLTSEDFALTPLRRYAASALDLMRWQHTQLDLGWTVDGPAVDVRTVAYHRWLSRQWTKVNRFAGGPDLHALLGAPAQGQAAVYQGILRGELDTASSDQVLRLGTNDRQFHAMGLQSTLQWTTSRGAVQSRLEVGARVHADLVDRLHTEDPYAMTDGRMVATGEPTITTLDAETSALAVALHAHEDLLIGRLRLLPGVRMEAIRTTASGLENPDPTWQVVGLPGLAVLVQTTSWLDLYGGVHRGFSPVAPGQAADVQPESAWNAELGGRAGYGGLHAELVGFVSAYDNLVGTCTFSAGCDPELLDDQVNGGEALVGGLEAVLGHRQEVGREVTLGGDASYTYTRGTFSSGFRSAFPQFGDVEAGDALPYVPEHLGSLRLEFDHPRVSLSVAGSLRGEMRDVAGQGSIDDSALIPLSFQLDVATEVRITPHLAAYATVSNLTNALTVQSYRPFGARPNAPISAMFGFRLR